MKPFDEEKYKLGSLCKRGHDYEETGYSLRRIKGSTCVECAKLNNRKYFLGNKEKLREYSKQWKSDKRKRLKNSSKDRNKKKDPAIEKILSRVKPFDTDKFHLGVLCKRNHDYEGTGYSLRYVISDNACVLCQRLRSLKSNFKNREKIRQRRWENKEKGYQCPSRSKEGYTKQNKKYYREHAEEIKERCHRNYIENREEMIERSREFRLRNPEKVKEYQRNYRSNHRQKYNRNRLKYYTANRERISKQRRQRYLANPEKYREISRQNYRKNPDLWKKHSRLWKQRNPNRVKQIGFQYRQRKRREQILAEMIQLQNKLQEDS